MIFNENEEVLDEEGLPETGKEDEDLEDEDVADLDMFGGEDSETTRDRDWM